MSAPGSASPRARRLFIANRGEIAARIGQTAALFPRPGHAASQSTRFVPLAIHTPAEAGAAHVLAVPPEQRIPLRSDGPRAYLDVDGLADLAKQHGAWGVAPGYGFLSESPAFAAAVEMRGMVWVGPPAHQLAALGDKMAAKELARTCSVPVLEGTAVGRAAALQDVQAFAQQVGQSSPAGAKIIIKALNGGGGRAMRVVEVGGHQSSSLKAAVEEAYIQCTREAQTAFGDERVYAERFLEQARHIEVQVLGDGTGNVAHLWERECSVQRRHQKLVEIAPSPTLRDSAHGCDRQRLLDAALRMASFAHYRSLGTFEFLYTPDTGEFFFMEINPRIQVEHTVTEQVTGLDLVALQLQLALGSSLEDLGLGRTCPTLPFPQQTSIQLRINAEKFLNDGSVVPTGGRLTTFAMPTGPGVRIDTGAHAPTGQGSVGAYVQTPLFDSLLAKVIVTAPTYDLAVSLASRRLADVRISGLDTNLAFMRAVLEHADLSANRGIHTRWVEERFWALIERASAIQASQMDEMRQQVSENGTETRSAAGQSPPPEGSESIKSPLAGLVSQILVKEGEEVTAGKEVVLIESMKMEHSVRAQKRGRVARINAAKGQSINEGDVIIHFSADAEGSDTAGESASEADGSTVTEDVNEPRPDLAALLERRRIQTDKHRREATDKRHAGGFLTARENIALLADTDSFIEWGDLVIAAQRTRIEEEQLIARTSNDGVIIGWATVNSALFDNQDPRRPQIPSNARCALCIYDYMVLAGTQGHFHHEKLDRLFRSVLDNPAPLVLYGEGGGGRPGDVDLMNLKVAGLDTPSFALMSAINARGYPTIGLANGYTFAGNAALLGACKVVVATQGGLTDSAKRAATSTGMGGPAMIEGGGLGRVKPEDVGPVGIHVENGDYDVVVPTEREASRIIKKLLSFFQGPLLSQDWAYTKDPLTLRVKLPPQRSRAYEVRHVLETLLDDDSFVELGAGWGRSFVTGLGRLTGQPVGVLASSVLSPLGGAVDAQSARKATRLLQLLTSTRAAHLVVLCDTPGFMVGPQAEKEGGLRTFADFFAATQAFQDGHDGGRIFAVTLRKAYGLGAQAVLGGSTHGNFFSVAWPQGEFAGMGIEGAVRLGMRKELEAVPAGEERDALFASLVDVMYRRGKAQNMAMVGEIDAVIDPAETRAWIIKGLRSVRARIPTWQADQRHHTSHL